jgi:DNA modification methylase
MTLHEESGRGWRLILGDCLQIMPTLDRVDHTICDPPYEVEAHTKARRALVDSTQKRGAVNTGKVRRIDQPLEISFPAITDTDRRLAAQLFAGLTSRWTIAFCQIEAVAAWRAAYEAAGLEWVRGGIWRKPNGAPQFGGDRPGQGFECLAIAHKLGRKRWNGGGKHAVWECPLDHGAGNGRRNDHPTQKPLALMMELVADFTDAGETILDPFAGSGTTLLAAVRLGRKAVGIERDEKFFRLAVERLRAEDSDTTLHAARAGQVTLFGGAQ